MQNGKLLFGTALIAAAIGFGLSVALRDSNTPDNQAAAQGVKFQTLTGKTVTEKDWQGDWVLVNYFAEWCVPCLKEVPELNAFQQTISNEQHNIQLYAVSYDALDEQQLFAIKQKYNMGFPLIRTTPNPVLPIKKPGQLPATFLISPTGEVVKTLWGEQTSEGLLAAVAQFRSQSASAIE